MNIDLNIKGVTRIAITIVLLVHVLFFVLEALLWMQPDVHTLLIGLLDNHVSSGITLQALTLKKLFINQGFYNLFLVIEGLTGLLLVRSGKIASGYALLLFMCFSEAGAGIVLACSTKAYLLALLQVVPAAIAFSKLYPVFRKHMSWQNPI